MTDQQAAYRSVGSVPGQDAIIRALESAGGELSFTDLKKITGMKQSTLAYHLKNVLGKGKVERNSSTGRYRLPIEPVGADDLRYWLFNVRDAKSEEAQRLAAEQFYHICDSKRIPLRALKETVLPFIGKSLRSDDVSNEVKNTLLRCVLGQMSIVADNPALLGAMKNTLSGTLGKMMMERKAEETMRSLARTIILRWSGSQAEMKNLVKLMETLVREPHRGLGFVFPILEHLKQAPARVRSDIRDFLFTASLSADSETQQLGKQFLPFFRTIERDLQ